MLVSPTGRRDLGEGFVPRRDRPPSRALTGGGANLVGGRERSSPNGTRPRLRPLIRPIDPVCEANIIPLGGTSWWSNWVRKGGELVP